jgi:hypothetical protein
MRQLAGPIVRIICSKLKVKSKLDRHPRTAGPKESSSKHGGIGLDIIASKIVAQCVVKTEDQKQMMKLNTPCGKVNVYLTFSLGESKDLHP